MNNQGKRFTVKERKHFGYYVIFDNSSKNREICVFHSSGGLANKHRAEICCELLNKIDGY